MSTLILLQVKRPLRANNVVHWSLCLPRRDGIGTQRAEDFWRRSSRQSEACPSRCSPGIIRGFAEISLGGKMGWGSAFDSTHDGRSANSESVRVLLPTPYEQADLADKQPLTGAENRFELQKGRDRWRSAASMSSCSGVINYHECSAAHHRHIPNGLNGSQRS